MVSWKSHSKKLSWLAAPVAASQVSDMLVHTADSIMVGSIGVTELAAVTVAGSAAMIFLLFAVGFTAAISPLASEAIGRKDLKGAARFARAGTIVSSHINLLIVGALFALSPLFGLLGSEADVVEIAIPYFRWIVASAMFRIWFGAFKQTAEALHSTSWAMSINVITNVVNIFLNWVLIYGNLGAPELGVEGAGIATFSARGLSVIMAWAVYRFAPFFKELRAEIHLLHGQHRAIWKEIRKVLSDGTGIGLQIVVEVLGFAFGTIMMGWISTTALAAHQIALNPASITFMVALGLGSAATMRVSRFIGEGDEHEARRAGMSALGIVVVYMLFVAAFYAVFRFQIPLWYVNDPSVVPIAATLLLWAGAFSLFDGIQVVGLGILRGYNDIYFPTGIAAISFVLITIPCGLISAFVFDMGPEGVWLGYLVGLTVASISYIYRFRWLTRHLVMKTP